MSQESLQKKVDNLTQAYKDKNRNFLQVQELYDKLKQKAMLGQIQGAAEEAVDSTLHGPHRGLSSFHEQVRRESPQDIERQSAWQPHMMAPPPRPPPHSIMGSSGAIHGKMLLKY